VEFGSTANKGATMSGIGMVTNFSVKASLDAAVTASITIKWSGAVTFTDVD
jgi:predicted secreted protein